MPKLASALILFVASGLHAQDAAALREFQTVSIKPNRSGNDDNSMRTALGRFEARNVTRWISCSTLSE